MKDLKHLIYFEKLLENANNTLIEQAGKRGSWRSAIPAFTCLRCC